MKDIIEKAIKEAREKGRGKIISRDDIYSAIFKAGYDKRESEFVYNPDYLDFDKGVETGKELGVRKVVEWIEKNYLHSLCAHDVPLFHIDKIPYKEWQAQKKVWGIKNGH